jgi:uncharacterized protein (DUF1697 family)
VPAKSQTWVALLRGINLGRNKRVAMADLRAMLESLGFDDVRTHLQSGNALFSSTRRSAPALEDLIASRIEADFGFDVAVMARTAAELAAVVDGNPFAAQGIDPKHLQSYFLSDPAPKAKVAALTPDAYAPDEFAIGDRVVYLHMPRGVMASKLLDFERALGLRATMRSWNVVTRLRDLAAGP